MDAELSKKLGFGTSFKKYDIIQVDNGDDIRGSNSTDEFVTKTKEAGETIRKQYGKEMEGIILMSRAKLQSKFGTEPRWYSYEFNALDKDEAITIKIGETTEKMPYSQIKERFKDSDGNNGYAYITSLYLKKGEETVKLQLKGKSQGNWFDFAKKESNTLGFITKLSIAKGEKGFNEVIFTKGEEVEIGKSVQEARELIDNKPKQLVGQDASYNPPTPALAQTEQVGVPEFTNQDAVADKTDAEIMDEIPF